MISHGTWRSIAVAALAVVFSACGSDPPAPDTVDTPTTSVATTAPAPSPAPTVAASAPASAPAPGALEPSEANLAKLLEGGDALTKLPTVATDKGAAFDPALRGKLAPPKPAAPSGTKK